MGVHRDEAAHGHYHGIAVHGLDAFFKMSHGIGGDEGDTFRVADQSHQSGQLRDCKASDKDRLSNVLQNFDLKSRQRIVTQVEAS